MAGEKRLYCASYLTGGELAFFKIEKGRTTFRVTGGPLKDRVLTV